MRLGFTGTRNGMTDDQIVTFTSVVGRLNPREFHHGDCIGADSNAHAIVKHVTPTCKIHLHPPIKDKTRAFCEGYTIAYEPKEYIERDHDIVDAVDTLVAIPKGFEEEQRSGTWATVRYARKKSTVRVIIIWPDGTMNQTVY